MRKLLPAVIFCLCLLFAACGTAATAVPGVSRSAEQSASVDPSLVVDTEFFSLTMAPGWTKMDIPGGVQIYKGSELLEISQYGINMTDGDDEAAMQNFIANYKGTPVEPAQMWGLQFRKTTCTYNGLNQTLITCIRDGKQLKIQFGVKGSENPDITAMLDSVKLR